MRHQLRRRLGIGGAVLAAATALLTPIAAADDQPQDSHGAELDAVGDAQFESTPSFNESEACGAPRGVNPLATRQGWLPPAEPVRGYTGGFFGRTIGDIEKQLVSWVVPMSGGMTIRVHKRALPAFKRVATNLAAEAKNGRHYQVRSNDTWGWGARTVGGSYSISHHALGTTIDVNASSNPYRSDGKLVTNMPAWYVDAWRRAGFCWGGDWVDVKDPMHFSWKGPQHTPNYGALPRPFTPKTKVIGFGTVNATYDMPWGRLVTGQNYLLADMVGNRLPDVVSLVGQPNSISLQFSRTNGDHLACATGNSYVPGMPLNGRVPLLGDRQRKGGQDLWLLDTKATKLTIDLAFRSDRYQTKRTIPTRIHNRPGDVHLLGDYDRDGWTDLFVIRRTDTSTSVQVFSGADRFVTRLHETETPLGDTRAAKFALGDRDSNGQPDLYVAEENRLRILLQGYKTISGSNNVNLGLMARFGVGDFDGDGRDDVFVLRPSGRLAIRLGNTQLPGSQMTSWFKRPNWTCSEPSSLDEGSGEQPEFDTDFDSQTLDPQINGMPTAMVAAPVADTPQHDVEGSTTTLAVDDGPESNEGTPHRSGVDDDGTTASPLDLCDPLDGNGGCLDETTTDLSARLVPGAEIELQGMVESTVVGSEDSVGNSSDVVFHGSGWGHGIGMSQYGAYAMALARHTYHQIFAHYYPGSTVKRIGIDLPAAQRLWVNLEAGRSSVVLRVGKTVSGGSAKTVNITRGSGAWGAPVGSRIIISGAPNCRMEIQRPSGNNNKTAAGGCSFNMKWDGHVASPTTAVAIEGCTQANYVAGGVIHEPCRYARGELHIRPRAATFDVSASMPIEHYVRGIAEMPYSWGNNGMAALRAQAIAARSYAREAQISRGSHNANSNPGNPCAAWCHVRDTTTDQRYIGWGQEDPRWTEAVTSTNRGVISHPAAPSGTVVKAFYSSSNGGSTEAISEAWGTAPVPYLVAKPDPWSLDPVNPFASWTATFSASDVARIAGLDTLTGVSVTSRHSSGSANVVEFLGQASAPYRPSSQTVRTQFDLRSINFDVSWP